MYCPRCRAEYAEGCTRCSSCDTDLVEVLPTAGPRAGWRQTLLALPVERWLKLGSVVYVIVESLAVIAGKNGAGLLRTMQGQPPGTMIYTWAAGILSAIMWGLLYYGVGEIIGLLKKLAK
ncbi:MAG: hypothetical protein ACM3X6_04720 [Patescibacteria group bacterium]